jgi:methylase of polypeptide subunit release factors
MASLAKTYSQEKLFGQVYTPDFIVCKILDDVGYDSPAILGKTIIDPACGDGRFLEEVVKRILQFSPKNGLRQNLRCVYGWDIDQDAVKQCIAKLNCLISSENIEIEWNISATDSIRKYEKVDLFSINELPEFDFIVGNPPYIRIQHLDSEQRGYIQKNYDFCKSGSTDIYIAFFELCLNMLSQGGLCGLITPNTYLFTETARPLRQYFVKNKNLLQITNYGDIQLFDAATTYSAITVFNKKHNRNFIFQKASTEITFEEKTFNFTELQEPFWQLSIEKTEKVKGKKLKDICNIHVGITTLCDSAFIFPVEALDDSFVWANTKFRGRVKIEKSILKPIVKGSRLKHSSDNIREYILFPYQRTNGKHTIIPEDELKVKYPFAYDYLSSVKPELDKRDNGTPNSVAWYAFGRSQGLDTSFGEKIIFSPMNDKPNFIYYANPDCTFYSGYCIKYDGDASFLIPQLNSERMEKFVSMSSRDFRGGWKAYNKKIVENFEIVC